jgi:hypothetical protein
MSNPIIIITAMGLFQQEIVLEVYIQITLKGKFTRKQQLLIQKWWPEEKKTSRK